MTNTPERSLAEAARIDHDHARARASIAAYLEDHTLHIAVYDARDAGLTLRQTAMLLRRPSRDVRKHWRHWHRCDHRIPTWGNPDEYVAAYRAIYGRDPDHIPFGWADSGSHILTVRHGRGRAVLRRVTETNDNQ